MTAGLEIRGLSKSYVLPDRTLRVLDGLDLVQRPGITAILGASGCGKTTLLRLVAGLERPDAGTVETHGARIGVVFQEPRLMPWLTAVQNIRFGLGRGTDTARLVEMTGLRGFEHALPHQLSGGMQQRVALARALADDPTLVLMDEPFAALDQITREAMQDELLRMHLVQGTNVLFVTHSIAEALYLGDRVVVLEDGRFRVKYNGRAIHTEFIPAKDSQGNTINFSNTIFILTSNHGFTGADVEGETGDERAMAQRALDHLKRHIGPEFIKRMDEVVVLMKRATRQFVRRQYNWFKLEDSAIHWFDLNQVGAEVIEKDLRYWLQSS